MFLNASKCVDGPPKPVLRTVCPQFPPLPRHYLQDHVQYFKLGYVFSV